MPPACWNNSTKRVVLPNGSRSANLVGPTSAEHVENGNEFLGAPGQLYFDRPVHVVYYVLPPGDDLKTADVEMPVLGTLIEGNGTAVVSIDDIAFSGLQFSYATSLGPLPPCHLGQNIRMRA